MSRFKLKFALAYVLAGIVAGPVAVFAASSASLDAPLPARKVVYGDLDLSRDAGVATLYARINIAAREVCEPMDVVIASLLRHRFDCRQDAIARAVADVNAPPLTNYFLKKTSANNEHQQQ